MRDTFKTGLTGAHQLGGGSVDGVITESVYFLRNAPRRRQYRRGKHSNIYCWPAGACCAGACSGAILFYLFGLIGGIGGKLVGFNDGVIFNFPASFMIASLFAAHPVLPHPLYFSHPGNRVGLLVGFRFYTAGLSFQAIRFIIGLRFDVVDLLIRFLLNGPRFIGGRIFNLFRVIFGLIQFIVDFR